MSGCNNYAENLWKKGKCSNCFRSKDEHFIDTKDGLHRNGEDRGSKPNHEASKQLTSQSNGHSIDKGQVSTKIGVDGGEFILKKSPNTVKTSRTQGSELFTKSRLSYQTTQHNSSNNKNTSTLKGDIEMAESVDKPRPVPRYKPRSSSKNESFEEDILKSASWIDDSKSPNTTLNETTDNANKLNTKSTDIRAEKDKPGNSVNSNSIQTNSYRKHSSNENGPTTIEGVKLKSKDEPIDSNINGDNLKSESPTTGQPSKDPKTVVAGEIDGEYMPMNRNVCKDSIKDRSPEAKQVENIKIASSNSSERNDSPKVGTINKSDSIDKPDKQLSDERFHNTTVDSAKLPSIVTTSEAKTVNNCDKKSLNSEPFYQNRRSVENERSTSTSSENSLGKTPLNITSPSDRPESIAFKVQVDVDEVRSSSIFEDMIVESSDSSCNSSKSNSTDSDNERESPEEDKTSNSPTANSAVMSNSKPFNSPPKSNPDVTKLVEGPSYANSDAKPQTKPYRVVDISGVVLIPEQDADGNDIPPLPPKEKELNRQKETSGSSDHYYYEPPDDVVPDYKKLTPLSSEPPPPVIIKKDGQGVTIPSSLKSMPVPRPRSQMPSHSSTLPRPVPRVTKTATEAKAPVNRPVSQVVTRPTNADAPRPPSTSSIPSRKHPSEVSPPTSPTGKPNSPERSQTKGSNASIDNRDIKPRRTAPPPPLLAVPQSRGQPSSSSPTTPTDTKKDFAKPNPSPSKLDQSSHSKSTIQSGKSTIKRALSSWKRISGRRKTKKRLDISSPVLVSEDSDSTSQGEESRSTSPAICTMMRKRGSTILEQEDPPEETPQETKAQEAKSTVSPSLPRRKPGRSYQNFPFSKSNVEKPAKPDRPGKPVLQVKPEVNQNQNEAAAYLEPCTGDITLKVETALANLNDAKILAETLTRVEQEQLGPLPQIPASKHVHFRFNETANKNPNASAVAPTVINSGDKKPRHPSAPNTKPREDSRGRSQSLTVKSRKDSGSWGNRSRSGSTQENTKKKRYDRILELHRQTLQDMIDSSKEELLPGDTIDLSNTRWNDYEVCGPPIDIQSPGAVLLPVVVPRIDEELILLAKVKIPKSVTEDMSQRTAFMQDMATTVSLPFHANVSRTITHFTDHLPAEIFGVQNSTNYETLVTITDQVPLETVQEFVERTVEEHVELPDEYERKVCILMLQLLSSLEHLDHEGVVHRGLTLHNLLLLDHGHLVLSNFSHVLQKSGGDTSTPQFHYGKESIGNIGEDPSRIPPEIHKAFNAGQSIDFEKCDSFSAGCLIYELLHQPSPFAVDSNLLSRDYTILDLPVLTDASRFTIGLSTLASSLLQREPSLRMRPRDALKLLQAFIWGPDELDETCLEASASDWLETERAHAVINIARAQSLGEPIGGEEVLENFLKYQYLVHLREDDVIEGYKALVPSASQA